MESNMNDNAEYGSLGLLANSLGKAGITKIMEIDKLIELINKHKGDLVLCAQEINMTQKELWPTVRDNEQLIKAFLASSEN